MEFLIKFKDDMLENGDATNIHSIIWYAFLPWDQNCVLVDGEERMKMGAC